MAGVWMHGTQKPSTWWMRVSSPRAGRKNGKCKVPDPIMQTQRRRQLVDRTEYVLMLTTGLTSAIPLQYGYETQH